MPQAVRRTLYKAWKVSINVCPNDRVDIKCGGPSVLGFDFAVDASVTKKKWEKFLRATLEKHDLPCMGIGFERRGVEVAKRQLWSERKIDKEMKGYHVPSDKRPSRLAWHLAALNDPDPVMDPDEREFFED